jgi:hypothetical protein
VLCNCPLSLSFIRSFIHSLTLAKKVPIWKRDTHILYMRIQNYHLNKKTKMASYVSYILVSNEGRKKKKHCADWYITDTHQPSQSVTLTHSQKYSSLYLTPFVFDFFFCRFSNSFFRQVQMFKFFYNPFFNSFTFLYKCKKNA